MHRCAPSDYLVRPRHWYAPCWCQLSCARQSVPPTRVKFTLPAGPGLLRFSGLSRLLKLFSAAVIDQVLLSGANFAVAFLLIRLTSDHVYGLYVLVQSAMTLLVSGQAAWLTGPMAVVASRKDADERRAIVGAVKGSQRRVLLWCVMAAQLLAPLGYAARLINGEVALLLAAGALCGWATLRREYLRGVMLLYSVPQRLVAADTLYVAALVLGVALATLGKGAAIVWVVAAMVLAALIGGAAGHRMLARDPGWVSGDARAVLREMRALGWWSLTGSLTYWAFTQSSNYLLALRLDLKAVADVNAARLLLMPAIVLTIGVQSLLMPTAAVWYAEAGLARLMRRLAGFIVGMSLLDLTYFGVIWLCRDWLIGTVLHKHIGSRDLLLVLWALVALIGLFRDVLQSALFALGRMKSLAGQTALSAVVALLLTWFGMGWWGAPAVLIGQIAGELINLAGIGLLLRGASRSPQLQSTT